MALGKGPVLVTGASGKIASRCRAAWAETMDLWLTDLHIAKGENSFPADLMDFGQVYRAFEGVDTVIHLAMAPAHQPQDTPPDEADPGDILRIKVNMEATYNVLEAARRQKVRRVVYISSMTTLLGNRHEAAYTSDTPPNPLNLYACTKLFGEQLARVYWRSHGLSTICLRVGQPFPLENPEFDDLWRMNKRSRSIFVEMNDLAQAVQCAVSTSVEFGVYPVVSASDNQRVDLSPSREIGYVPRAYLSDSGLTFHDGGRFPACHTPILTHNPGELP